MGWPLKDRGTFQRSPFKFCAAAKSPSIFSVSFRTVEGRKILSLVTCADLTFADQTFADQRFANKTFADPLDCKEGPKGP